MACDIQKPANNKMASSKITTDNAFNVKKAELEDIDPIELEQMLESSVTTNQEISNSFLIEKHQAEAEKIELNSKQQFIDLRKCWSGWLIAWISFLLVFHVTLTTTIGFGWTNFVAYQWFLPLVVIENFLQIAGMGFVIVKFLYPSK